MSGYIYPVPDAQMTTKVPDQLALAAFIGQTLIQLPHLTHRSGFITG